jgi:hypothetical protein
MVIFVEGLDVNIFISTFCVSTDGLQGLPKALQRALHTLLFISLKFFTNSEMLTETLIRIPSSVIHVLQCRLLIGYTENASNLLSQAAFGIILRDHMLTASSSMHF